LLLVADILQRGEAHFDTDRFAISIKWPFSDGSNRSFVPPLFTRTGSAFIVESCPNYQIIHPIHPSNMPGIENPPCKLQLVRYRSQKMISDTHWM